MKIALFSWEARYAIQIGGVGIHVTELATALAALGNEVHIFTRLAEGQNANDIINGVYFHRCEWSRSDNFIREVESFNHSLGYYFNETVKQSGDFDLIHCHDWLTFIAGQKLRHKCPLIATFHTTEWGRSGVWPESEQARYIADIEKSMTEQADAVIAVSYEIRRQIDLVYKCPDWKLSIIYHGINTDHADSVQLSNESIRASYGIKPEQPLTLFVGSLNLKKGADILLDAIPKVLEKLPEAKFIFAGTGEMRNRIESEAKNNSFQDAIKFVGIPENIELLRLFKATDIVAAPYRYDPFGIVALSAWAASHPVIISGFGAANEFIYNNVNGIISSVSGYAGGLVTMLENKDKADWTGRNGRVTVETSFSWEAIAKETEKVYHKKSD